ncbi:MAG: SDR family NAD(P)-dependent oxidoreductase [Gammaproteobacteria bacterium]|jgi:NADP-dependent 3-hydroxy acid dehydrogenase YdfG
MSETTPDKKQIIVTGASSGIGRAVATRLLEEDFEVIGIARYSRTQPLEHPAFINRPMDLSDIAHLPLQLTQLVDDFPAVSGIVFCAGRGQFGSLEEFSYAQIRELMDLNFISQAYLARAYLPLFKQRKAGHLIFMGSEASLKGSRKGGIYCASKFALRGFAQALRDECSKSQVRVSIINPGMVRGAFFDELDFEPGSEAENYLEAEDIAQTVAYIFTARFAVNVDEINLSPLKHVVQWKTKRNGKK